MGLTIIWSSLKGGMAAQLAMYAAQARARVRATSQALRAVDFRDCGTSRRTAAGSLLQAHKLAPHMQVLFQSIPGLPNVPSEALTMELLSLQHSITITAALCL